MIGLVPMFVGAVQVRTTRPFSGAAVKFCGALGAIGVGSGSAPVGVATITVTSDESAPEALVAVTVKVKLPAVVGVPESTPALLRVSPVGKAPVCVQVGVGVPDAVNVNV